MRVTRGRMCFNLRSGLPHEWRAVGATRILFISFDVTSPSELMNSPAAVNLLFTSGNCLDIQLATDPRADPKRETPVPGDVRLLVLRQNDKAFVALYQAKVRDFEGEPIVLTSPTGKESFDEITVVVNVGLKCEKTPAGFRAVVSVPFELIGLTLEKGRPVRIDLGFVCGNAVGTQGAVRSSLFNRSFSANVVNDIPNESRLEPADWGLGTVE